MTIVKHETISLEQQELIHFDKVVLILHNVAKWADDPNLKDDADCLATEIAKFLAAHCDDEFC